MTTEQDMTLVFKDQTGEYYLLPLETLKQGWVPAEHKAEVEWLLGESEDVQGHVLPGIIIGFFAGIGAGLGGYEVGKAIGKATKSPTPTAPPNPDIPVTEEPGRPA